MRPGVLDCSYDKSEILDCYNRIMNGKRCTRDTLYGDGHAGEKIAAVIESLEDISINKRLCY